MTRFQHVVEIGAGDSYSSEGLAIAKRGDAENVTLYEPNAILCADLARAAQGVPNVIVHEAAVTSTFRDLYHIGYASYLRGAPSFLATSVEADGEQWWEPLAREVSCVKVDRADWGTSEVSTIDGLILTVNGGELDVLRGLVSRPKVIWTKHYLHNGRQWANANETWHWFRRQGYTGHQIATNQHGTFLSLVWELDTPSQPT